MGRRGFGAWVVLAVPSAGWISSSGRDLHCLGPRRLAVEEARPVQGATPECWEKSPAHWGAHGDLRDFVVQRAVQTQLFYMTSTRDGPKANWLARFLDHGHLDSTNKAGRAAAVGEGGVGEGGDPFSYRARFGGLRVGHDEYMRSLAAAEPEILRIEIAPSRARLSTMERNNPFLASRKQASFFYDESIEPRQIAGRVASTATAMVDAWTGELAAQAEADDARVYIEGLSPRALAAVSDRAGFADDIDADDNMPLFDHDKRALARWTTLRAATVLLGDLGHCVSDEPDEDDMVAEFDADLFVGSARRRAREAATLGDGGLRPKKRLAAQATAAYFGAFVDEWCPRLVHGADDDLVASLGKAPPGLPRRQLFRGPGTGQADADEALEALTMDRPPVQIPGGYLVDPRHLATTLRAYRASVAYDAIQTLTHFKPNLAHFAATAYRTH